MPRITLQQPINRSPLTQVDYNVVFKYNENGFSGSITVTNGVQQLVIPIEPADFVSIFRNRSSAAAMITALETFIENNLT